MKKLLLIAILALGAQFAQAQEVSINGGSFINKASIPTEGDEDQRIMGYLEIGGDFFEKSKFRLGPVVKMYAYDGGLGKSLNDSTRNDYGFSAGAEIGWDLSEDVTFGISGEVPIPDQRDEIYEMIISPTLYFGFENKVGIKVNYDYFINKKLFEYHSAFSVGLIWKFN